MTTTKHSAPQGRSARAAELVAQLLEQLPAGSAARATARDLEKLFHRSPSEIRALIDRVPGNSLAQKGDAIGIPRGTVWAIWKGKYLPSPEIMDKIEAAVASKESAQ